MAEAALNAIRDKILDLSLAPGMQLDEGLITTRLGISRTPAREALNRLVTEGLVENRSSRGFFVKSLELGDVSHFFDAYVVMERASAYFCRFSDAKLVSDLLDIQKMHEIATRQNDFLAISYQNSRFHLRIVASSENPYLIDASGKLHNMARRLGSFVYQKESADLAIYSAQQAQILEEHRAIVDALRAQDRTALLAIITSHAERFRTRIARFIASNSGVRFEMPDLHQPKATDAAMRP
jgi:DNA-binding GntR family transcriptional regulator